MSASPSSNSGSSGQAVHGAGNNLPAAPGSTNQEMPEPIAEHDRIAPRVMPPASTLASNKEYSDVVISFFATLVIVEENGNSKKYVQTDFLRRAAEQLEPIKQSCDQLARIARYPSDLFKVLDVITSGPPRPTRDAYTDVVKVLTESKEVMPALKLIYKPSTTLEGDDILIKPLMDWCQAAKDSLIYLGSRSRMAVEALTIRNRAKTELDRLSRMYDELTSTLCNRESVNKQAQRVVWLRQKFVEILDRYFKTHDQVQCDHAKLFLRQFTVVDQFDFEDIERRLQDSLGLWNTYPNVPNMDVYALTAYKSISDTLSPFLEKIRTFTPTAYEQSQMQVNCMSPKMAKLKVDANTYITSDEATLGQGNSLIKQMDNMRVLVQNLQLSGHFFDETALGLTQDEFEVLYAKCKDKVSAEESKKSLRDHRDKIEAQELAKSSMGSANLLSINPLTGIDTWLSFVRSHAEVVVLHESDQIRKAVTLKALQNKEDKAACLDLTYTEMMTWLRNKYDDPSQIVRIVETLKKLPAATSDKTSYHNLTKFSTAMNQLKLHNSENKLDKSTRHDLLRILLVREHWMQFIAEERDFEKTLKGDDPADPNDAASIVSAGNDEDKELQRREFYVERMEHFLSVIRSMCTTVSTHTSTKSTKQGSSSRTRGYAAIPSQAGNTNVSNHNCVVCKVQHKDNLGNVMLSLARCPKFKKMTPQARFDLVKKLNYCKRCLKDRSQSNHTTGCEESISRGRNCNNHDPPSTSHHVMLCLDQGKKSKEGKGSTNSTPKKPKKPYYKKSSSYNNAISAGATPPAQPPPSAAVQYQMSPVVNQPGTSVSQQPAQAPAQQTTSHMANVTSPSQGNLAPPPVFQTFTPRLLNTTRAFLANSKPGVPIEHDCELVRELMSCATYVTAIANTLLGEDVTLLCMQDTGSGLGFCTFDAVRKLNLPQTGTWHGVIQTLDGDHEGTYPVFGLFLRDIRGITHWVKLLGVPHIGKKSSIPQQRFTSMCQSFGLDPGSCQNTQGDFDILLGVDSCTLLADRAPQFTSALFPDAAVFHSILSPYYFLVGAAGSPLDKDVRTCTYRCEQNIPNHFMPQRWHRQQAIAIAPSGLNPKVKYF